MPSRKSNDGETVNTEEVQAKANEAEEKGYIGTTPDPFPNEAYSLKSGPDSPSAAEVREALLKGTAD